MEDKEKPKQQLINELAKLRQQISDLETSEKGRKWADEEMKRLNRDLSTLYTIDFAAAQSLDMEIMLNKVLETVRKALEIDAGSIYLREPNGDMTLYVYHGFSGEFVNNMQRIKSGEGVFDAVYAGKKPVVLDSSEYPANRFASFIIQEEFHTLVIVPLISGGELIGILCMASHKAHAFPIGETELLSAIGQQMGTTMRNAWLYEKVQRELDERKCAEKALRESEEKYRCIVETANEGIWMIDPERRTTFVNQHTLDMLGYSPYEILGHNLDDFVEPEEIDNHQQQMLERHKGKTGQYERRLRRKDGLAIWCIVSGTPIFDDKKQFAGSFGMLMDITQRKRAEERLSKLNGCFLNFGTEPLENINRLVALCGELMGATCALYNRLDQGMLCSWGQWNTPQDYNSVDKPEGHICYDTITRGSEEVLVIHNLPETLYARTDPNVRAYNLKTYIGKAVKFFDDYVGSLCLVYQNDFSPSENDKLLMGVIASAIAIEEKRKRAEDALKESETQFRSVVESAVNAVVLADSNGTIISWNKGAEKIFLYTKEGVLGKPLTVLMPQRYRDAHVAELNRVTLSGEFNLIGKTVEMFGLRKDGTEFLLELSLATWKTQQGTFYSGIIHEITERKLAAKELQESEERYRQLVELTPDGFGINVDGKIAFMNTAGARILGVSNPELLIGKSVMDSVHPDYREIVRERVKQLSEEKTTVPFLEEKYIRLDGTNVDVEVAGVHFIYHGKTAVQYVFRDITQRKQAEEITKESEEKFRNLVECSLAGVYIIQDGKFPYVNPKLAEIFGYMQDEIISSKSVSDLVAKDDRVLVAENIRKRLYGEMQSINYAFKGQRKDGELIDIEVYGTKIDYKGKPAVIGTLLDITESKKSEETRLENLRLEAADKAKSEFLANMSHELRTPLNASIGFSELLKMGLVGKLTEKQEKYVDYILTSNQFLLTLINDILDLSKIEAGKIELVPDKMSVPETIEETLDLIKEKAMKHKVVLKTQFDPELECIEADKQRFKQILFNLLSNAVKFSKEEGGTVTITAKKEGDMAQISVSDTGIGIKEENIGKLFQKFEQLDPKVSQKYGGTGLGLAITKQLVELHRGRIWAESRYGEGSTFTFTLPFKDKRIGKDKSI